MGRPQWEQIVAQAPREKLQTTVIVQSNNIVNGSGSEVVNIYAPAGYISKVVSLRVDAPACTGATSGFTECYVRFNLPYNGPDPNAGGIDILGGRASYNNVLKFNLFHWENADVLQYPPEHDTQATAIKGVEFDDTVPLQFIMSNDTNGTLPGDRIYSVTTINRQIAK